MGQLSNVKAFLTHRKRLKEQNILKDNLLLT